MIDFPVSPANAGRQAGNDPAFHRHRDTLECANARLQSPQAE
jgi:hypothetical protein